MSASLLGIPLLQCFWELVDSQQEFGNFLVFKNCFAAGCEQIVSVLLFGLYTQEPDPYTRIWNSAPTSS